MSTAFWATHGRLTSPGRHATALHTLPRDLPDLCAAIRGLVIHYRSPELPGRIARHRFEELRLRRVEAMLRRILELDPRPLWERRPPRSRLIGCCRDFAVLLCATLRERGTPARVRVGFANYLGPDGWIDHWLTERWDARARRWMRVDAEFAPAALADMSFNTLNVPGTRFTCAGDAWLAWRSGSIDATNFGYDADNRGAWVIRANLLHDVACLSRIETTPWDFWGLALPPFEQLGREDLLCLDLAGEASQVGKVAGHPRLQVPRTVMSYSLADVRAPAKLW